jgi:O-antigen/teichoic acid export membrane protein
VDIIKKDTKTRVEINPEEKAATTNGMTSKVVKGSIWVLVGQVVPLIATFIASPFVIRYLGSEAYGVLLIVAMIPSYFAFSNFGMGLASTKFGSEAYGNSSFNKEAAVIRTAAYIAFCSTILAVIPLFIFANFIIVDIFKIPEKYHTVATIGLRATSIGLLFNAMSGVFNTPQLTRLKMGLNVIANAIPRILMTSLAPVVVYMGGGITGAAWLACIASVVIFLLNIFVSGRLLPQLYNFSIDRSIIKPLIKFGKGMILYDIAFMIILNMEKFLLPNITESPSQVAYYSIAFTLANMTNMFTLAIGQTLIPAFSQMLAPEKKSALNLLFSRSFRGCIILLLPACMFLLVIAQPFFTLWAGQEYGINSTTPFYILMAGVFFSLMMYIPNSILLANGRTGLFAKTYSIQVVPYFALAYLLISKYGIAGAALTWSIREIFNSILFYWFSKKYTGISYQFNIKIIHIIAAIFFLAIPVVYARGMNNFSFWNIPVVISCVGVYFFIVWKYLITNAEQVILKNKITPLLSTIGIKR